MDQPLLPSGSFDLARRGTGLRPRPLLAEQERVASETPARADRAESLDGYVPSALIPTEKRMLALAVGGAPAWSRRLKRIESLTEALLAVLSAAWQDLARSAGGDDRQFSQRWRAQAAKVDVEAINDLIRRHNEYYPIERRLPMDVRTGDFIGPGGREFRRQPLDADWVLSHFPADLERALGRVG